jgi:hypothetical protein
MLQLIARISSAREGLDLGGVDSGRTPRIVKLWISANEGRNDRFKLPNCHRRRQARQWDAFKPMLTQIREYVLDALYIATAVNFLEGTSRSAAFIKQPLCVFPRLDALRLRGVMYKHQSEADNG